MILAGRKTLVVGYGKTGAATVDFLLNRGAEVRITDISPRKTGDKDNSNLMNKNNQAQWVEYDEQALTGVEFVIPSPGVPPSDRILATAVKAGIMIISETELASRFLKPPLLAITGTNGKTTTVTLLGQILEKCGRSVFVGGNIGEPLIGYVSGPQNDDYVVAEVSSFQLQWIGLFKPRVAAMLNVTDNHLDYHGSLTDYRRTKEKIFTNQGADDLAIINAGETESLALATRLVSRLMFFSAEKHRTPGMFLQDDCLIYENPAGEHEKYPVDMVMIPGRHNLENVMAAIITARECGCPPGEIIAAVRSFKGIPHRIEYVGKKNGVLFYDDSKGTNVGAVQRALESFDKPVVLLMGGRDKDSDFSRLGRYLTPRVKRLITFGEAGGKIASVLEGTVATLRAEKMRDAIVLAYEQSDTGDVVLLSPGCASFDEFNNYGHRGRVFKDVVASL